MAPKTGSPRGKKKNIQVAATKPVEKNKTGRWLMNLALGSPSHNLAPGSHRKKQVSRSIKAKLHFPIDRIRRYLKEGWYSQRIGFGAPVYLVAVLEYLITEVLKLTEQAMKDIKNISIIPRHVMLGIMRDEELSKLLVGFTIVHSGVLPNIHESLLGDGTVEDAAKLPTKDAARLLQKTTESR